MSPSGLARFIRLGQQADPVILEALRRSAPSEFRPALSYHFEVPGKRMRAAMVVLSCAAAGGRAERAIKPAAVVEMIHNYSLVMDDLIDRGEVRRGRPTVRVVMGDSIALLVAMFYREVLDDVLEICGEKTGKQQAKDIIEHKLGNAAILIALRFLSRKDREEFKKIIGSERVSTQMLKKARSMVNKTPAERECREIAMKYLEDAKASLSVLKPSPFKDALSDLADQVVARSY